MTRRRISEEEARLLKDRYGFEHPKVYKVRVKWTGDQERIESQAGLLGFKDVGEYIFRCAILVTERLEHWRVLCEEDGR